MLSRTSQTTRGYDSSRIIKISRTEEPNSHRADITLHNVGGALTSLDFEHYQAVISKGYKTGVSRTAWVAGTVYAVDDIRVPVTANGYQYRCSVAGTSHATTEPTWPTDLGVTVADNTVTWEMDGNSGDEYARAAPLRVRVQELHSGMGVAKCILRCIGLQDQLKEDKAKAAYTQTSGDTNTVKTLISAVCAAGAGLSGAYNGYTAITVVYDSEDSLIDTFIPADYFSISINESRWDKIEELLGYTGCKARFQNDGKLHILDPVISGTTYDYEYKWNVSGDHLFWNKSVRLRFVNPNEEVVKTAGGITPAYSGSATSATSYALDPKTHTTIGRFVSNAQCNSIAAARIERYELDDEKGLVVVPPNVGQELWDYVKVTDSVSGDTRIGNIQYISDDVEVFPNSNRRPTWAMRLAFGKASLLSIMASMLSSGGGEGGDGAARLTNTQIFALFDGIVDYLKKQSIETVWLDETMPDNLDDILDGISYQRLLATQISAGKIYLSDASTFKASYDPSGKRRVFTAEPTTPYDVGDLWLDSSVIKRCTTARASGAYVAGDWTAQTLDSLTDGTTYSRVLTTSISAGKILLSQVDGTLDDVAEGISYGKLLLTDLSAGHINLYSGTVKTGEWYDVSGVEIDATHGINIYGTNNALTTRATKAGTIQCYVGADGKLYAGAGAVWLDSSGITIKGQVLSFIDALSATCGQLYGGSDVLILLGDIDLSVGNAAGGGIEIFAGSVVAPEANTLKLRAVASASLASGSIDPTPSGNDIWIDSDDDVWIYADTDVLIKPANRTYIDLLSVILEDVEASRAKGTTYTNSTGFPLIVIVSTTITNGQTTNALVHATADPPTGIVGVSYIEAADVLTDTITFIVPVGYKYRVNSDGSIATWFEGKIGASA